MNKHSQVTGSAVTDADTDGDNEEKYSRSHAPIHDADPCIGISQGNEIYKNKGKN